MMGLILRQTSFMMNQRSDEQFASFGITWVDFQIVKFLSEKSLETEGDSTVKEIAEFMKLSVPVVAKSIKLLESKGLISQGSNDTGLKGKGVSVTDEGKYFCSQMFKVLIRMEIDLLAGISSRDQGIIRNGLMKMYENLQKK